MSVAEIPAAKTAAAPVQPLAVQPYLCFEGRCEEAINFYRQVLGAQVTMMMRFGQAPADACEGGGEGCGPGPAAPPPADKIMHASLRVGASEFFATDGMCTPGGAKFSGFNLSLPVPDEASADRAFTALAEGGKVCMPLAKTFFSPRFGMVTDKFGVTWMVIVPGQPM